MNGKRGGLMAVVAAAALGLAGCNPNDQAKVQAQSDRAGQNMKAAAQNAGVQLKQASANAKHDLTDGTITFKVKNAMSASDKLNTSGINVDTKDKVVHLRGAVADANQKALAERIAQDTVGKDVQVVSELAVKPAK